MHECWPDALQLVANACRQMALGDEPTIVQAPEQAALIDHALPIRWQFQPAHAFAAEKVGFEARECRSLSLDEGFGRWQQAAAVDEHARFHAGDPTSTVPVRVRRAARAPCSTTSGRARSADGDRLQTVLAMC